MSISAILSTSSFFPPQTERKYLGHVFSESRSSNPVLFAALAAAINSPTNKSQSDWPSQDGARAPAGRPLSPHSAPFQWQMLRLSAASWHQQQSKSVACSLAAGASITARPVVVASPPATVTVIFFLSSPFLVCKLWLIGDSLRRDFIKHKQMCGVAIKLMLYFMPRKQCYCQMKLLIKLIRGPAAE